MTSKRLTKTLYIPFAALVLLACEKKTTKPATPEEPVATSQEAVMVLNDGSGYDTIHNRVANLQGIGSAIGNLGVFDFSVENNNLNYVWYSTFQSQQSNNTSRTRTSVNLGTKASVALPQYASDLQGLSPASGEVLSFITYRPYTNLVAYCLDRTVNGGGQTARSAEFGGDITASIPRSYDVVGTPDLGYRFPVTNTVRYQNSPGGETRTGYYTVGVQSNSYLYKVCNPVKFSFSYVSSHKIFSNLLDVSNISPAGLYYSFDLRDDSLIVYNVTLPPGVNNSPPTAFASMNKIAAVSVSGLSANAFTTQRHYSADGKTFGMLFKDNVSNKCWTFSFDYTTGTITKGIENAMLDYSGTGSDIDLDEYGNVYYSGTAANGTNAAGVSIYKKNTAGTVSLMGSDNFLKFGEITNLRFINGKIYLVVAGRITDTFYRQCTFLRQN